MAYIVPDNILFDAFNTDSGTSTASFTSGSAATNFPITQAFNNNASNGFKSGSNTLPVIIVNLANAKSFDAVCVYGLDEAYSFQVHYSTTANVSSASDSSWVQFSANQTSTASFGSTTTFSHVKGEPTAMVHLSSSVKTSVRSLKFTFTALATGSVLPHIQLGNSTEVDISTPYSPPLFRNFEQSIKRNNLGKPMINDMREAPVKITINLREKKESEMKTLADLANANTFQLINKPFMVTTSYDTSVEDLRSAYFCMIDKSLSQPRYTKPTVMSWTIKAVGYM